MVNDGGLFRWAAQYVALCDAERAMGSVDTVAVQEIALGSAVHELRKLAEKELVRRIDAGIVEAEPDRNEGGEGDK